MYGKEEADSCQYSWMGFKLRVRIPFQKMLLIVALISSQFKFDLDEFIESLCNLSNQMPEDGSTNWDLPPRFDDSPDEADEMVQDYVADLTLERNFN